MTNTNDGPRRPSTALDDAIRLGETRADVLDALAAGCPEHGTEPMDWDAAGAFCHTCWNAHLRNNAFAHLGVVDVPGRAGTRGDATTSPEASQAAPGRAVVNGDEAQVHWLSEAEARELASRADPAPRLAEYAGGRPQRWLGLSHDAWYGVGVLAGVLAAAALIASLVNLLISGDLELVPMAGACVVLFAAGCTVIWLYRDVLARSEQQRKTAIAQMRMERERER